MASRVHDTGSRYGYNYWSFDDQDVCPIGLMGQKLRYTALKTPGGPNEKANTIRAAGEEYHSD